MKHLSVDYVANRGSSSISFPFEEKLSTSGKDLFSRSLRLVRYPDGSRVKLEGETPENLPMVYSGAIRVFKSSPNGRGLTLYRMKPGDSCMLAAFCILRGKAFPADAVAEQACEAFVVSADAFRTLHAKEKAVQDFVVDLGLLRIVDLIMIVEEVAFRRMDERLARFLLRESRRIDGGIRPVRMSHEEIATELGTAREVISRLLYEFQKIHLVRVARRCVEVENLPGLEKYAEGIQTDG